MPRITGSFVEVPRTGRYFRMNSVQPETKNIWVCLHGYGQLAKYFIRHFEKLDPDENLIIAPEGLSRFYVEGVSGRVGASWLTREDREYEIKDQSGYINAVLRDCNVIPEDPPCRFIVLGFSQGTAMAVRWMVNNNVRPDQLVLWAGSFPHDVNASEHPRIFNGLPVHFAYGDRDPFLKHIDLKEKIREFGPMGVELKSWPFKGEHTMDSETLQRIVDSFGG